MVEREGEKPRIARASGEVAERLHHEVLHLGTRQGPQRAVGSVPGVDVRVFDGADDQAAREPHQLPGREALFDPVVLHGEQLTDLPRRPTVRHALQQRLEDRRLMCDGAQGAEHHLEELVVLHLLGDPRRTRSVQEREQHRHQRMRRVRSDDGRGVGARLLQRSPGEGGERLRERLEALGCVLLHGRGGRPEAHLRVESAGLRAPQETQGREAADLGRVAL